MSLSGDDMTRVVYLLILLVAVGGWVAVEYRTRVGFALRTALAWGMIFLGVAAGYGLWTDIREDFSPHQSLTERGEIAVDRASDGHYYLKLNINGTEIRFMADTGASGMVLSRADAERLGLNPGGLTYTGVAQTANGQVRTARVTLKSVVLGPFQDKDVRAYVNDGEMGDSLLGMDYLGRFRISLDRGEMLISR